MFVQILNLNPKTKTIKLKGIGGAHIINQIIPDAIKTLHKYKEIEKATISLNGINTTITKEMTARDVANAWQKASTAKSNRYFMRRDTRDVLNYEKNSSIKLINLDPVECVVNLQAKDGADIEKQIIPDTIHLLTINLCDTNYGTANVAIGDNTITITYEMTPKDVIAKYGHLWKNSQESEPEK